MTISHDLNVKLTGNHYIAGQLSAASSETFTSVNPRTKEAGAVAFHNATPGEINDAVTAATAAFEQIRAFPAAKLADFLDAVAAEIEALGDVLLETADMETGLGLPRLTGERGRTTGQLRAFASLLREGSYVEAIIDTALPDRQPAPRPDIRRMLVPLGPVGVFSASNFPFAFAVAGGDTASAFAAGCPVIVKAHPGHPATSELFAQAITQAVEKQGFPAGMFSLLQGNEVSVGQNLVKHPGVKAIGFTGSLRAGRAIYDAAAARQEPIPVYAEMGSINPIVILPGALEARGEALAEGLVGSVTLGSGQFCTNPGLVMLVKGESANAFIGHVKAQMQAKAPGVLLNEHIEQGLAQTVKKTMARPSVKKLIGGEVIEEGSYCYQHTLLQTTSADFRHDAQLQTEHFGPVTMFVLCDSLEDLQATIASLHGQLTATIHAEDSDIKAAAPVLSLLREKAGRLLWNGFPTGVEVVYSMQHGGPYPATTAPGTTSVGMTAIKRFLRPVAYQNIPESLLPDALKSANPLGILRIINNEYTREALYTN
ncbi:MAG: aldehyde dehydrogenase (NADP(+)) [Anaerolineae bacterium]|nr:aldehyde dehydrogenase (NADP(+)) [Anaerolineae bacterium]